MHKVLAAAALLMAASPACADIRIGVVGPLSGPYQTFGQQMLGGAKAAVDAFNAKGGIAGEQVGIINVDDQCDATKAEEAAQKLIAAQVDVVIGSFCSNAALAEAKILDGARLVLISPSATLPAFTEIGLSNVIRVASRTDAQGAFAAKRILAKRPNAKLAVLDDGTAQMKLITTSFAAAYGKAPAVALSFTPDLKDFGDVIAKLKAASADTLYVAAAATDAGRIAVQAQASGVTLKRYGPDPLLADQFWEAAGAAGENTLVSFPADPQNTSSAKGLAREMKALGEPVDGPALPAYAAVQLYAAAAESAGPHSSLGLAKALKTGSQFETAIGPFSFDAKGDATDLHFSWFSWNNGQYQTIAAESQ